MENAADIVDALGVKAIAKAVDVTEDAVRQAMRLRKLPASWFNTLEVMAGHSLPRDAFTFKGAS
jgi:prophage antirepressor-like protein